MAHCSKASVLIHSARCFGQRQRSGFVSTFRLNRRRSCRITCIISADVIQSGRSGKSSFPGFGWAKASPKAKRVPRSSHVSIEYRIVVECECDYTTVATVRQAPSRHNPSEIAMGWMQPDDLITRLCRRSGRWIITAREADSYMLRPSDAGAVRYLQVRHKEGIGWAKFQADLPVSFPLDRLPEGLAARLLMRSPLLDYSHWSLTIWGSCDAVAFLTCRWPASDLSVARFDAICGEMVTEIRQFHEELVGKFRGVAARPGEVQGTAHTQARPATPSLLNDIRQLILESGRHD